MYFVLALCCFLLSQIRKKILYLVVYLSPEHGNNTVFLNLQWNFHVTEAFESTYLSFAYSTQFCLLIWWFKSV